MAVEWVLAGAREADDPAVKPAWRAAADSLLSAENGPMVCRVSAAAVPELAAAAHRLGRSLWLVPFKEIIRPFRTCWPAPAAL